MKKKGFSVAELIIAFVIIGTLAVLGYNLVHKNVASYDKLFYYTIYKTLTDGFADAVYQNVGTSPINLCNHFSTLFSNEEFTCSETNKVIKTKQGIEFSIGSEINVSADGKNYSYYVITASSPNNPDIEFIVNSQNQEIFPISDEIINDAALLPVYLISDFDNGTVHFRNAAVTNFITYRQAVCLPNRADGAKLLKIVTLAAYTNYTSKNYCSGVENISWLNSIASTAPVGTYTLKTDRPVGYK